MKSTLTKESIAALPVPATGQAYYWDDVTTGLGVVVGHTGVRTFVFVGRVRGVKGGDGKDLKRRVTIGIVGALREDGHEWTLKLARERANELLVEMRSGNDPNALRRKPELGPQPGTTPASGPTLRDGMKAHLARMTKKRRAERTIETFEHEVTKYLAAWLDRPFAELTGDVLVEMHDAIKARARDKANRNQANAKGAALANRVMMHVSACWNSLNKKLHGKLGDWNPVKSVDKDTLKPKRERLPDAPDWYARVMALRSPIRRDGLLLAVYTGLRHEDVREIRWEHVDLDEGTLVRPDPKGGESAAFTLPITKRVDEILRRRKDDNARDLGKADAGYVFPAIANDGEVGPISDLREQVATVVVVDDEKRYEKHRIPAEDVHSCRREWESVAQEIGISELDQHVLSNHSYGSRNVNQTYIAQHFDYLATCAQKIDDAMHLNLTTATTPKKKKTRPKLRSVS
jgi:integrase